MEVRLVLERGGDGTTHRIAVLNDTESSLMTLFDVDLQQLGNVASYLGYIDLVSVTNASGGYDLLPELIVQIRLIREDLTS